MNILALDFGGTSLKYGIMNEAADIVKKDSVPSPLGSVQEYLDSIVNLYEKHKADVGGIAISMPGKIHSKFGLIEAAGSYSKIRDLDLFQELSGRIPVPIAIENDGKCGALAELWKGALEDVENGVVITIGTAVGGAIIINRKLYHGQDLSAGELSFLIGDKGDYSLKNRMGTIGGMSGLILRVVQAKGMSAGNQYALAVFQHQSGDEHDIDVGILDTGGEDISIQVDGQQIFKWVEEGDPVVLPIYQDYIEQLAKLIYNLYVILDPEKVLIGGGISNQPRLIMDLNEEFDKMKNSVSFAPIPKISIETCQFKSDANMIGAVYNFMLQNGNG